MNSQPVEVRQGQGLAATLSAVTEGRVDFAFGWTDGLEHPLAPGIHHQLVRWEPVGVVVPADHPLASLEQVATCDLAGYPLIMHTAEEAVDWQSWVEAAVDAFGLHIGWRLHGHGRGAANAAVLTLEAPAFAPVEAPVPPGVVYRPLVDPIPVCPIEVVWRSRETPPARIRQALGVIRDIVQEHRWLNLPESEYWLPPAHGRQAKS
jgi:DNA-binding transcriptional LysR family regulator